MTYTPPADLLARRARLTPDARRQLDGLPAEELLARLLYVEELDKAAAAVDAPTARGYSELSVRVLGALPRAEVVQRTAALEKTASAMAHDADMRSGAWGAIVALRGANPEVPAPFVEAARARIAAEAAPQRQIVKVRRPAHHVDPVDGAVVLHKGAGIRAKPIPRGAARVRPAAGAQAAKSALTKAAAYEQQAAALRDVDPAAARGYDELAKAERAKVSGREGGRRA